MKVVQEKLIALCKYEDKERVMIPGRLNRYESKTRRFNSKNKSKYGYAGICNSQKKPQALIMIESTKGYLGSYETEKLAATAYDIAALRIHGLKA